MISQNNQITGSNGLWLPILAQCSTSINPENVRKPEVFRGYRNGTLKYDSLIRVRKFEISRKSGTWWKRFSKIFHGNMKIVVLIFDGNSAWCAWELHVPKLACLISLRQGLDSYSPPHKKQKRYFFLPPLTDNLEMGEIIIKKIKLLHYKINTRVTEPLDSGLTNRGGFLLHRNNFRQTELKV